MSSFTITVANLDSLSCFLFLWTFSMFDNASSSPLEISCFNSQTRHTVFLSLAQNN